MLWRIQTGALRVEEAVEGLQESDTEDQVKPRVRIDSPRDGARVRENDTVTVTTAIRSEEPIAYMELYLNGALVEKIDNEGEFVFTPKEVGLEKGAHTVLVVAYTSSGQKEGDAVEITVR
jgi:hypothetical protein